MLLEAFRRAKVNAEPSPSPALSVRLNGALIGSIPDASSGWTSRPTLSCRRRRSGSRYRGGGFSPGCRPWSRPPLRTRHRVLQVPRAVRDRRIGEQEQRSMSNLGVEIAIEGSCAQCNTRRAHANHVCPSGGEPRMSWNAHDRQARAGETVMAASFESVEARDVQVVHAAESRATSNDPLVFERLIADTSGAFVAVPAEAFDSRIEGQPSWAVVNRLRKLYLGREEALTTRSTCSGRRASLAGRARAPDFGTGERDRCVAPAEPDGRRSSPGA
jgi:hypothetical protein